MLKRTTLMIVIATCFLSLNAQTNTLQSYTLPIVKHRHHRNLAKWDIPAGNFSGITPLGNNRYAVVTDKPQGNGFYEFEILLNNKGKVTYVHNHGFRADTASTHLRDSEGIAYLPKTGTLFISAEDDQQIREYTLDGNLTGRMLSIPKELDINHIYGNYGFESLTHSPSTHSFWTITENSLKADGPSSGYENHTPALLRLVSFSDSTLEYTAHYAYRTDAPKAHSKSIRNYCFGVPDITALPDGSLLIIERELVVRKGFRTLGTHVRNKIYRVVPSEAPQIHFCDNLSTLPNSVFLPKTLVTEFKTTILNFSNYEAICLGPVLPDGSQTLILLNDSQNRKGNSLFHLRDHIKVIIIKKDNKSKYSK